MIRPNWRFWFPKLVIRFGPVAFVALALQLLVIYAPLGPGDLQRRALLVLSYVILLGFVAANLRRPGIAVIGVGVALNFLAIVSNGGLMAVSPEVAARVGTAPADQRLGEWIPQSKDVMLERGDTRLWVLTDILTWENPTGINGFSVGDVVVAGGLVLLLGELLLPRVQRLSNNRPSLT